MVAKRASLTNRPAPKTEFKVYLHNGYVIPVTLMVEPEVAMDAISQFARGGVWQDKTFWPPNAILKVVLG